MKKTKKYTENRVQYDDGDGYKQFWCLCFSQQSFRKIEFVEFFAFHLRLNNKTAWSFHWRSSVVATIILTLFFAF